MEKKIVNTLFYTKLLKNIEYTEKDRERRFRPI